MSSKVAWQQCTWCDYCTHDKSWCTQRNRCRKCKAILGPARCVLRVRPLIKKAWCACTCRVLTRKWWGKRWHAIKARELSIHHSWFSRSDNKQVYCLLLGGYSISVRSTILVSNEIEWAIVRYHTRAVAPTPAGPAMAGPVFCST